MMKRTFCKTLWALLLVSASLTACKDEDGANSDDGLDINHWMEKMLRADYLWSDEIPESSKLNYSAEPEQFFRSMLSMKDGKTRGSGHRFYSYIEKNKEYKTTRTSINRDDTYGIEFTAYAVVDNVTQESLGCYYARVLYVLPNSPAEMAGLERGNWIMGFNGRADNYKDLNDLLKGGAVSLTVAPATPMNSADYKKVTMEPSRAVEDNPLYVDRIIERGSKKIGYLLYNHFTTGPGDYTDRTYDKEMQEKFRRFANEGVNEFVLDLRYNGGGYLISANVLASLLVPAQRKDAIFSIDTNNKGRSSTRLFSSEGQTVHLNLNSNRLFVLTSSATASASEAVINGLSPFMDVILIGETTEGKNVGSVHYAKDEYEWAMQPITLRITSSDVNTDYSAGLPADHPLNELANTSSKLLPLGDENELMLSKALEIITGNKKQARAAEQSTAFSNLIPVYQSIERHQTNGVWVTP